MRSLAWVLLRAGGWVRPALVVLCTAVSTALLLVALAMLLLPAVPTEPLLDVVADTGTRGGAAFGAAVLVVPVVLLLHQALRLGQAARDRRLAGLRVAGVTPREVRRLGALEVGYPAVLGAVLGVVLFALLRAGLGAGRIMTFGGYGYAVGLVPAGGPPWWAVLLLVLAVVGGATLLGLRVGRDVQLTPQGTARRQSAGRPRAWGWVVLLLAAAAVVVGPHDSSLVAQSLLLGVLALVVLGLVLLAPWTAWLIGRTAQDRVRGVGALLACRRLVHAPGPAGRAGAAVGGIGLAGAVVGTLLGDLLDMGQVEFYFVSSLLLVGTACSRRWSWSASAWPCTRPRPCSTTDARWPRCTPSASPPRWCATPSVGRGSWWRCRWHCWAAWSARWATSRSSTPARWRCWVQPSASS